MLGYLLVTCGIGPPWFRILCNFAKKKMKKSPSSCRRPSSWNHESNPNSWFHDRLSTVALSNLRLYVEQVDVEYGAASRNFVLAAICSYLQRPSFEDEWLSSKIWDPMFPKTHPHSVLRPRQHFLSESQTNWSTKLSSWVPSRFNLTVLMYKGLLTNTNMLTHHRMTKR